MLTGHTSYHAKTETLDLRAAKFLSADGEAVYFLNENALLLRRQHWRKPVRKHCQGIMALGCGCQRPVYAPAAAGVTAVANVNSLNSFSQGRPRAMSMRRSAGIMT